MKYDLIITVPLGVSIPGTPVKKFLEKSLDSLLGQKTNFKFKIIIAADTNIPEEIKKTIENRNIEICWYEPYYYFRKGGIWKKIYDQWEKFDTKYVAFCHYDDVWSNDKIQNQISFMEENKLELSWSKVIVIDKNDDYLSEDLSIWELNKNTIFSNSYAFCHSSIITKEAIKKIDILSHKEKWSANYEKLFFVYCHKLRQKKCNNTIFFHRNHDNSITNTFNNESENIIKNQRNITNYSLKETIEDAHSIDIQNIIKKILEEYE